MAIGFKYYGNKRPRPGDAPIKSASGPDAVRAITELGAHPNAIPLGRQPFNRPNPASWMDGKGVARFNETNPVPQAEPSFSMEADGMAVVVRRGYVMMSGRSEVVPLEGLVEVTGGEFDEPHWIVAKVEKTEATVTAVLKEVDVEPAFYAVAGNVETFCIPLCRVYVDASTAPRAVILPGRHVGMILLGVGQAPHPWKVVTVARFNEEEPDGCDITVTEGARVVIGGSGSMNPEAQITLSQSQYESGVYLIKEFDNEANAWVDDISVSAESELLDDVEEDRLVVESAAGDGSHTHEVDALLFPNTLTMQRRLIAHVSSAGVRQYAVGSIYVIGHPDEEDPGGEDPGGEDPDGDGHCDQNTDPQDRDTGPGGAKPGEPEDPADEDPFHDPWNPRDPDDPPDDPSDDDCYSTVPESVT